MTSFTGLRGFICGPSFAGLRLSSLSLSSSDDSIQGLPPVVSSQTPSHFGSVSLLTLAASGLTVGTIFPSSSWTRQSILRSVFRMVREPNPTPARNEIFLGSSLLQGIPFSSLVPTATLAIPVQSLRVEKDYLSFVIEESQRIRNHLQAGHDRGLLISPVGLRDSVENFLKAQFVQPALTPELKTVSKEGEVGIVIVVRGIDNFSRWRERLNRVFEKEGQAFFHREQSLWEIRKPDGTKLRVTVASIDSLKRVKDGKLKEWMSPYGMVILDHEHHVRVIDDNASSSIGQERERYANLLEAAGFIGRFIDETGKEEFRARDNPGKYLLGMTESVSEGAGRIYGGRTESLIAAHTLPELLEEGIIRRPEVRVVEPKSSVVDQEAVFATPHEAWSALSPEERVRQVAECVESLWIEKGEGDKIPRTVIYATSREEARSLHRALSCMIPAGEISMLLSDDDIRERKRLRDRFFRTREARVLIHVLTELEGVDEYQRDPVDLVVYAGVTYAGGKTYALQGVGGHLGGNRVPLLVDMSGLFACHPDLTAFDPYLYALEEGELKRGSLLRERIQAPQGRSESKDRAQARDVYEIDIFGNGVGEKTVRVLSGIEWRRGYHASSSRIAMQLWVSEEIVDRVRDGGYLPHSVGWMRRLAEGLGLTEEESENLLDAWAEDRADQFHLRYPIPETLTSGEQSFLKKARVALFRYYSGDVGLVRGSLPETLKRYLENGMIPEGLQSRSSFLKVLASLLVGGEENRITEGIKMVADCFPAQIRSYWIPKKVNEFAGMSREHLETYFVQVGDEKGMSSDQVDEIVLQLEVEKNNSLKGFRPVVVGEEIERYCRIRIRRRKGGFELVEAEGNGAVRILDALRETGIFWGGILDIPTNARLIQKYDSSEVKTLDQLRSWTEGDLERRFLEIAKQLRLGNPDERKADGKLVEEIVLQAQVKQNSILSGFCPAVPGEKKEKNCCRISIRRKKKEGFVVTGAGGNGAVAILNLLRDTEIFWNGILDIPTNAELIHKDESSTIRTLDQVRSLTTEGLEGMFSELAKQLRRGDSGKREADGRLVDEIVLQTIVNSDNSLSGFRPIMPGEGKEVNGYCRIRIRRKGGEGFVVVETEGSCVVRMLDALRETGIFWNGTLDIPTNARLIYKKDNSPTIKTLDQVRSLTTEDLEGMFSEIAKQLRRGDSEKREADARLVDEIVLQTIIVRSDATAFRPVALGEERKKDFYCRIRVRRREGGGFEVGESQGINNRKMVEALRNSPAFQSMELF